MSDFRRTGDYLRKKYNTAIEVTMNQDGTGFMVADKDFKGSTKNELVYVENSPDYCLTDRSAGEWTNEELGFVTEKSLKEKGDELGAFCKEWKSVLIL